VEKPAHIVKSIETPYGLPQHVSAGLSKRVMSAKTADLIKDMMRDNVKEKYGESNFPGLNLCAKTGTAETVEGTMDHSLFVGFMDDSDRPYAFIVVAEHSGAGANVAAHVANTVLQAVKKKY
jgi:peptidoglycan glycosyltransferase